ncbi:MAG TPA: flagellar export protein FliJ [Paenalcaligenes sp.]|nr:flagellar export protein FliJ [Paenalcaligenes sp.]
MVSPSEHKSFQRLLELNQTQLEQTAQTLRTMHQNYKTALQQLQQLEQYHQEYAQRLNETSKLGVSITNYHNFLRFIGTLETAIAEQNNRVVQLSAQRAETQQKWQELQQRCNAFETLIKRAQHAARYEANRHEQRHNDEIASQLAQRAQAPFSQEIL